MTHHRSKALSITLLVVLAGVGALASQSCAASPAPPPTQPSADPSSTAPPVATDTPLPPVT